MMPRWTNVRWRSSLHPVINRHAGRDRWFLAEMVRRTTVAG